MPIRPTIALQLGHLLRLLFLLIQRHLLHKADVVVFRQVAVFLQVRAAVGGHGLEEVFDEVVRDEGVAEVELGDVGLLEGLIGNMG